MTAQIPAPTATDTTTAATTQSTPAPSGRRDVQILPIASDTTVLRSRSWKRLRFEIEYALEKGTTANSYLIRSNQTALIDPPGASFTEKFITALKGEIDPHLIDYIVLGHVNPNRIKTLNPLLELAPQSTIVCSLPAKIALEKAEIDHPIQAVKGGSDIDLGQGHHLEFIPTPTPRWPGGMCTYDSYTEVLFSDKFFGAHLCGEEAYDLERDKLLEDQQYYFDCLMAPNAQQVETALEKLSDYAPRLYAVGQGPLVRYGVVELTQHYQNWAAKQKNQTESVALIYASAYGNTATIAQAIARGITKAGVSVNSINA